MKYYANINSKDELTGISRGVITADEFGSSNVKNILVSNEIGENAEKYGANYYIYQDGEILENPNYEAEQQKKERERINMLSMTRGDMFEALILAKGLTKAQVRGMIEQAELDEVTKALYLNRFDEALEFYRGYPIFDLLGAQLGITSDMLDRFFETRDYHYLTTCTLTINATPETSTITGAGIYPYGTEITYAVETEGYVTKTDTVTLFEDTALEVVLDEKIILKE